jgi:hypothetical protein
MKLLKAIILIAITGVSSANGKGWRGITPLHSTRADVERLLGPPIEQTSPYSAVYRTPNETVTIRYAKGLPCGIGEKYSQWRVPTNTVEGIFVTLATPVPLTQLGMDESKYKKRSGSHTPDTYYISEEKGESLRVFQGEVKDIDYFPAASDVSLACQGVRQTAKTDCEGLTPPPFKSYGDVNSETEKLQLDNFVLTLRDEVNRTGYIVAYGGRRSRAGEARITAERARKYLITVRHLPPNRLRVIDGGFREERQVDLYVVEKGVCPPTATPTVDPRDAKIIGAQHRR